MDCFLKEKNYLKKRFFRFAIYVALYSLLHRPFIYLRDVEKTIKYLYNFLRGASCEPVFRKTPSLSGKLRFFKVDVYKIKQATKNNSKYKKTVFTKLA